jgi:DNA-binding FadR family transcriptional regulator
MKFKTVRQERLYMKVAEQLSQHIESGAIPVGERLPSERDLAEQFGVSRPTIREAMIALELAGQVEIRTGSGVYVKNNVAKTSAVAQEDVPGPIELLEARYFIESDAAALAAERATKKEISALKQAFEAMRVENRSAALHEEADERFHMLIARATRNSAIHGAVAQLWQLRRTSRMSVFFHDKLRERGIKPVIDDHRVILEMIRARDPEGARRAMRAHLQNVIDVIVSDNDSLA